MEGQWLILARVLRVAAAQAGQAVGDEAGDLAQVEQEELAAVGEAEEDAQPQAEQAEVAEAEQAAAGEAEVAAVEEAEEDAQPLEAPHAVVGLQQAQRVMDIDRAAAEAAAAGHAAAQPDFTISVAPPARVTLVTAGNSAHPNHAKPDMYPYVIAAGPFYLLARFSTGRYHGANFNVRQRASHLVVVRHFRDGAAANARIVATAERVPGRTRNVPVLTNVESVGFLCNADGDGTHRIAELRVITGPRFHSAVLVSFRSGPGAGGGRWSERKLRTPLALRGDQAWTPHGTVAVNNTVIWFDLSWGMLTCDDLDLQERLEFARLPPGLALGRLDLDSMANIHTRRCIALSGNYVRYVEIIVDPNDGEAAAATVSMWYRRHVIDRGWQWSPNYMGVSFQNIWNHPSYTAAGLLQNAVPDLMCISPANPSVIYFALDQRLFGVDVPNHTVLHCEGFDLVDVPRQPRGQASARFIVPWDLNAAQDNNIGYVSMEPYVTFPEDVSDDDDDDDEVVQDQEEQFKTSAWDRRGPKSIKITPMKVRRRQ